MHQRLALVGRRAFAHGDQPLARRHDVAHRCVHARFEAQVAVGDDAHHLLALEHREAGNAVLLRQFLHVAHGDVRRDGDRIAQQARLVALDSRHLGRLLLGREILVNDADAALLRDGDGQARFGHGVHRGGHQRHVQLDVAGQACREAGVARQDLGVRRHQQHIVEGERFAKKAHGEGSRRKSELYGGEQGLTRRSLGV